MKVTVSYTVSRFSTFMVFKMNTLKATCVFC